MVSSFFKKFFSFFSLFIFLSYLGNSQRWSQIGSDILSSNIQYMNPNFQFGYSVSSNGDGTIIAVGAPNAAYESGTLDGQVTVYKYENSAWTQIGNNINGLTGSGYRDHFGRSVSLSDDGTILAIGIPRYNKVGAVIIYQYTDNTWTQLGSIIEGVPHESNPEGGDRSGFSVSLSNDGTIVAIGGPEYIGENNSYDVGQVRLFKFENNSWVQLGQNIIGEKSGDKSGYSVSLSSDGNTVAIGATENDGGGTASGHVRVFRYSSGSWTQLGGDIDGEAVEDRSGNAVSLSNDGNIVAIGAWTNDGDEGDRNGHVRVYQYSENSWKQMGSDIDGEYNVDHFGYAVAISDDGKRVVGGAKYNRNHPIGNASGHIRVFEYQDNSSSWVQLGDDIDGNTSTNDEIGFSVAISNDGKKVFTGGKNSKGLINNASNGHGIVKGYEYRDPNVTLSSPTFLPETAGSTATVTVTLEFASSSEVKVILKASGTASGDSVDYYLSSDTIKIPAGQTTGTITVNVIADQISDDGETIILDIDSVVNAIEATEQKVTIVISEDICTDSGGSNLTGLLSSDKTLYKSCSPYTVTGNWWIKDGATVTVEKGVTININDSKYIKVDGDFIIEPGATLNFGYQSDIKAIEGRINAQGNILDSITFSGNEWLGITLKNNSVIKYAILTGATYNTSQITDSEISNSTISNFSTIYLYQGSKLKYNKIHNIGEINSSNSEINYPNIIYGNEIFDRRGSSTGAQTYVLNLLTSSSVKYNRIYETKTNVQNIYAIIIDGGTNNSTIESNILGGSEGIHGTVGIYYNKPVNATIKNNVIGGYIMDNVWTSANFQTNTPLNNTNLVFKYNSFIGEMNLSDNNRNVVIGKTSESTEISVDLKENYWGNVDAADINNSITDFEDDFEISGNVDFSNALSTPHPGTPISSVKNLKVTRLAGSTELSWDANIETDLAGYKVHYGTLTNGSYNNVLDIGNVTSKTLTFGLGTTDGITVTAYDSDADGTDDQIEGHESWFVDGEVVSAPVAVNDSYQIVKGGELDLINGPFAHYQFDKDNDLTGPDDNQRLKDISGNGYDIGASYLNSSFVNDRFDKENQALRFNGYSMVSRSHDDVFNFKDQNKWSIYFWVKMDKKSLDGGYYNGLLSKFTPNEGWSFINTNQYGCCDNDWSRQIIQFVIYGDPAPGSISSQVLDGEINPNLTEEEWNNLIPSWHQVVTTYDGSELSFYIDGVKKQSVTATLPDITDSNKFNQPLIFGNSFQTSSGLNGSLDDVRFYNRALTSLEIQDMYTDTNVQSFQGVLANDTDLDGDTLTATLVQSVANGTLTFNSDGKFKYVPSPGFSGKDSFTYKATDGTYSSSNTTVNISVSTPPVAKDDTYTVKEDSVLTIDSSSGVLANDSDPENDVITAVKFTDPSHGSLTLNSDGSFTYDHDGGASTIDSFKYKANDGIGSSDEATVTITVETSDDAPVANPDVFGTEQDQDLVVPFEDGVLKNDTDEEGDAMTVELVTDVTLGTLSLNSDGSFTYNPPDGQKGIDTFYYKVKAKDLYSNTTYATININGRPVIKSNQVFEVEENKPNGYTVGQIDIEDESSSFTWQIQSGNTNDLFSIDNNGYIKVNNKDSLNYERITRVELSVRANDGTMWSEAKVVTINIKNVNDMAIISYNITPSYCSSGTGTGAISLEIEGQEGDVTVSWSSGDDILSIQSLVAGTYTVTITDAIGQTINESYEIQLVPIYEDVEICFITADYADYTRNRVYVKIGANPYNIDKYLIYREGVQAGVYDKIGELDPSEESFVDTGVDNRNSSYRYKVRIRDKCGNLSPLSDYQETIHLSSNAGIDGRINLQWTPYKGISFSTYEIYRKINNGDFELLTQISSNTLAYSDVSIDYSNQYKYFVAILAEVECAPAGEAYNGDDLDTPYFGTIDLNNPVGLKGKKVVRPRGNQEIIESTDDDGDGVFNDDDQCPNTPDGETVDGSGCSDSQKDADDDGVSDDKDTCPNTPDGETVDGNGCSDSQKDTDGDGIYDNKDTCPNTPDGETVDGNGCSDSQKDTDGDGINDDKDTCPNTPDGETVDGNGCSNSQKDTDGDGVSDDKDTCPDTPQGETVDANGCSDSQNATDTDGDGVNNDDDLCPDTPQGETVDANGCSDSQKDSDSDGVTDDKDECPDTPQGEQVFLNGCSLSQQDTDGDGVSDDKDICPNTPDGEAVDGNGCSDSQKDSDGDGVTDDKDECPDTPQGEQVFLNGCSLSQQDTDGDGVSDDKDQCPNTPQGETVDDKGCPAPLSVERMTFVETIFPNPTDNMISVRLKGKVEIDEIFFIDFSGKYLKPKSFEAKRNLININVSNLDEGIYLLNISSGDERNMVKVIIER